MAQTLLTCTYCGSREVEQLGKKYRCKKCGHVFDEEGLETLSNTDYEESLRKQYGPPKWKPSEWK